MATFSGTQSKCKSCGKTAYPMEQIVAEGIIFHKACFRCSHCKNTLKLNNFVSLEGVFYCKPHFEQLFQATGSFSKSFADAIKTDKENPPPPESITGDTGVSRYTNEKKEPSPLASKFGGTQEKCLVCGKIVYLLEKITVEGTPYHTGCFKCVKGGCTLTPSSFKTHQGKLYCKHHFNQMFLVKGNFSTLQEDHSLPSEAPAKQSGTSPAPAEVKPAAAAAAQQESPIQQPKFTQPAKRDDDKEEDDEDDDDE